MLTTLFAFVVVLGVLIFFHELGHFLVARLCGVGVEKFSLGFGPRIVGKKIGVTDYRLSAIPFGGYVKLVGDEVDEDIDPEKIPYSFNHKHVLIRFLIVAAGPAFNLLLAVIIIFAFNFFLGIEDVTPVVRHVEAGSPADLSGIRRGDVVVAVDDVRIESWSDIDKAVELSEGRVISLTIRQADAETLHQLRPEVKTGKDFFGDPVPYYDVGISGYPRAEPVVGGLTPDYPAQAAGIKKGDRILAIDGEALGNWRVMSEKIASSKGRPIKVRVQRGDKQFDVDIIPRMTQEKNHLGETVERPMIGISAAKRTIPPEEKIFQTFGFFQSIGNGFAQTYAIAKLTVVSIVKLIQGAISSKTLGGPIMIAEMAGQQARAGANNLLFFIALLSVNLGILNMLPIPVLDGGHLFFFIVELVIGRPINLRMREIAQQVGIFILILLMAFVIYNDITRTFFS